MIERERSKVLAKALADTLVEVIACEFERSLVDVSWCCDRPRVLCNGVLDKDLVQFDGRVHISFGI